MQLAYLNPIYRKSLTNNQNQLMKNLTMGYNARYREHAM